MTEFDFELARQIKQLAKLAKDSNPHWICTPSGEYETNAGNDWCADCGFYMFRHLRKHDRKRRSDYYFDGGWCTESDGHRFCAHCQCWLRVSLTGYAVEEELAHYRENGVRENPVADEAYSLDLLISAVSWGSEHTDEVMALARDLVSRPDAVASLSLAATSKKSRR